MSDLTPEQVATDCLMEGEPESHREAAARDGGDAIDALRAEGMLVEEGEAKVRLDGLEERIEQALKAAPTLEADPDVTGSVDGGKWLAAVAARVVRRSRKRPTVAEEWTPDSWRDHPINQQPDYGTMPRAFDGEVPTEFYDWMPRAVFDVIAAPGKVYDDTPTTSSVRAASDEWGWRLACRIAARYGAPTPSEEADRG